MEAALAHQPNFWRISGIVTLVVVAFYVIVILVMLVAGGLFALFK